MTSPRQLLLRLFVYSGLSVSGESTQRPGACIPIRWAASGLTVRPLSPSPSPPLPLFPTGTYMHYDQYWVYNNVPYLTYAQFYLALPVSSNIAQELKFGLVQNGRVCVGCETPVFGRW